MISLMLNDLSVEPLILLPSSDAAFQQHRGGTLSPQYINPANGFDSFPFFAFPPTIVLSDSYCDWFGRA